MSVATAKPKSRKRVTKVARSVDKPTKTPKTAKAKTKAPPLPEPTERRGRPKGSKSFKTPWIAVRHQFAFAKLGSVKQPPGLRRIVLECSEPEAAIQLERLALAVNTENRTLLNLLKNGKM